VRMSLIICAILVLPMKVCAASGANASPPPVLEASSHYDPGLLPATAGQIQVEIEAAGDDQLALYEAIYHAAANRLVLEALADVQSQNLKHPNDAAILAACSLAYGVAEGDYLLNGYHRVLSNFDSKDQILYGNDLAKAEQLNSNLWLVFLVKAQPAIYPGIGDRKQALVDLRSAVRLGPLVPYTHLTLAYFLCTPTATPEQQQEAIIQAKSATRLKPEDSEAAFLLFEIYALTLHDREDGLAYKQIALSEIPPGYKLSDAATQLLANFPK